MATYEEEYNKGIDEFQCDNFNKASKYFRNAIKIDPAKPETYYNLALTLFHSNCLLDSEAYFKKYISLNPNDHDAYYNLGILYKLNDKNEAAIEQFFKAIEIKNDDESTYYNLGLVLLNLDKLEEAIEQISMALVLDPDNIDYKIALAKIYEKKSESFGASSLDQAITIYNEVFEVNPKLENVNYKLAVCYAKKGLWSESVKFCQNVIDLNPNSFEAYNQLGLAMYCSDDIDYAILMYKKAININLGFIEAYKNLALALEKQDKTDEAVMYYTKYIQNAPKSEEIEQLKLHINELKQPPEDADTITPKETTPDSLPDKSL